MSATTAKRIDQVNVGLIILSLALAIYYPFRGFLVAYAFLGPLHYLTELNWLHTRNYFIKDRSWLWIALAGALVIGLPEIANDRYPIAAHLPSWLNDGLIWLDDWANGAILLTLLLAIGFVFVKKRLHRIIISAMGLGLAYLFNREPFTEWYVIIIGMLVPTLIHVYAFTLLFMVFGAKKNKSYWGFGAVALALLVPVVISFIDPMALNYVFPESATEVFADNGFHGTNALFGKVLGLTDGSRFYWYETLFLRLQIFITFAYIYHYLNWFSKTSIIGWHKNLSVGRTLGIILTWLVIAGLFYWDYRFGFLAGFVLSFLHVLGEFPLNVVTIQSLLDKKSA